MRTILRRVTAACLLALTLALLPLAQGQTPGKDHPSHTWVGTNWAALQEQRDGNERKAKNARRETAELDKRVAALREELAGLELKMLEVV